MPMEIKMMRSSLVAALVLSPLALAPSMLLAQANSSAQSKGLMVNAAAAGTLSSVRISTGVVAPKLVTTVAIQEDGGRISQFINTPRETVVSMTVDANGKPTGLKVVKSLGDSMDKNVLAAVSQYRFQPGTVSGQATEFPLNLAIEIQK
jgi:TonB family protein